MSHPFKLTLIFPKLWFCLYKIRELSMFVLITCNFTDVSSLVELVTINYTFLLANFMAKNNILLLFDNYVWVNFSI